MKNILLLCSSGLSTSLLVNRIQKVATERDININVSTTSSNAYKKVANDADIILLGPQVGYMLRQVQKTAPDKSVSVIDSSAFKRMNGSAVLDHIVELLQ